MTAAARIRAAVAIWALASWAASLYSQTSVLTWHNDNARTGQNLQETILTPANVNASGFGKLFTIPVDGKVDAQPLFVPALMFPGDGVHNALYVVTEHDSAFAFDADTGALLWHVSLAGPGETPSDDRGCGQVTPEIGATATPVIDPQSGPHGSIYMLAMSKDSSGHYHHRLHALDLTTGAEEFGGPAEIQATYPGTGVEGSGTLGTFDAKQHKSRPALLIVNGVVYTSWGSHCDISPYTPWLIGYSASTLQQSSLLNLVPNGEGGGIWASGAGPAADANGNIFLATGNGTFDTTLNAAGFPQNANFGNAFVKIPGTGANPAVADYFTMSRTTPESNGDLDLGSGGLILLPSLTDAAGQPRSLAVGGGKDQTIYVVDQNNMGKWDPNKNSVYQQMTATPVFSTPAWFNGTLYYGTSDSALKAYRFTNGQFVAASRTTAVFASPGTTPSISANGTSNGIVWAAENASSAVLHAYDATDLSKELYNSNQAANSRDEFGAANKFIVPTVVNGKVYVGTTSGVGVFGLLGPQCSYSINPLSAAAPPGGATGTVSVTAPAACSWTASSNAPWITITSTPGGAGTGTVTYSVAPNNSAAPQSGTLTIAAQTFTITQASAPVLTSVLNSASAAPGPVAPGEIVQINGSSLGPAAPVSFSVDPATGTVDSQLAGTSVLFGGFAAPILYTSAAQINAIAPYELAGQAQTTMQVGFQGALSPPFTLPLAAAAPGVFTLSATGSGQAAAVNQDGSVNGPSNPASRGSYVSIYFTGGGQTSPPSVTGSLTDASLENLTQKVTATVGGVPAIVTFAGAAPTLVSGVAQLNLQLANNTPVGSALPLVISVGGVDSPSAATLAVQ